MPIRSRAWDDAKVRRFAERWNAGESSAVLREVYGRAPSSIAVQLRKRGVALKDRRPGAGKTTA